MRINKPWNLILIICLCFICYTLYVDIDNKIMGLKQWLELLVFEFIIQALLEYNLRK